MMGHRYYGYDSYGMGHHNDILPAILIILFIVLLVLFIRKVLMNKDGLPSVSRMHHQKPLDIIRERYAKGEINKQEFEEKKKDLES